MRRCATILLLCAVVRSAPACDSLVVSEAWLREPPPGAAMAAAYFTITNAGASALTVMGVSSADFEHASLHETYYEQGRARMRAIDSVPLEPNGVFRAKPGGAHVMLGGRRGELGASIGLRLHCSTGPTIEFSAPVRRHAPDE